MREMIIKLARCELLWVPSRGPSPLTASSLEAWPKPISLLETIPSSFPPINLHFAYSSFRS